MRPTHLAALFLFTLGCTRGSDDTGAAVPVDNDGDGLSVAEGDCNDNDPLVHIYADEECDGIDNDCNGEVDDGRELQTWYLDVDADGFGNADNTTQNCDEPDGYTAVAGDCDDSDAMVNPDAVEDDCTDDTDYNCDGTTGYADGDNDGVPACEDCDDADPSVRPGATEVCNGIDDDCDGSPDDDAAGGATWYIDADGDGYGDGNTPVVACEQPDGYSPLQGDCNDGNPGIFPGADENCDGNDENCNGITDEDAVDAQTWYADIDGDGHGNTIFTAVECNPPDGYVDNTDDCDDLNAATSPDATEQCGDGTDNDCDGSAICDGGTVDADGDDYSADGDDCDDGDPDVNPDGIELCDGVDDNCDGTVDDAFDDLDGDLIADCVDPDDDGDGEDDVTDNCPLLANPGQADLDGDLIGDLCDPDADGDGRTVPTDCDDTDPTIAPGAADAWYDGVDSNCDGADDFDQDGDGEPSDAFGGLDCDDTDPTEVLACGIYDYTTHTFTNCSSTGRQGPTLSDCRTDYVTLWDGDPSFFDMTSQGIQRWTVPETATYRIDVRGARGGQSTINGSSFPGRGARMVGDFDLTEGDVLQILVGQVGDTAQYGGGGGGGTFVVGCDDTPLIIGGGGGGARRSDDRRVPVSDAHTATNGRTGYWSGGTSGGGGTGNTGGNNSSGGGGLLGNGGDGQSGAQGGFAFVNGGNGGQCASNCPVQSGAGGFGGGGGTYHHDVTAAGGGYSGGGGGSTSGENTGGGGGSYNIGANPTNTTGENDGPGSVTITKL